MDSKTYVLLRTLEVIKTVNPVGCGGYEQAFNHIQQKVTKTLEEFRKKEEIQCLAEKILTTKDTATD